MTGVNPTLTSIPGTKLMGEVRDLKDVARRLNKESDAFQEILSTLNKKLAELNLGLEVWLEHRHQILSLGDYEWLNEERTEYRYGWIIGYTKLHDGWSIAAKEVRVNQSDPDSNWPEILPESDPVSLLKAPRQVRIEAAEMLSNLIDRLKAKAEQGLKAIEKAKEIADKL